MIPRWSAGLVCMCVLATACTLDGDSVNQWDLNVFPVAVEWELGDQLAAELEQTLPAVADAEVQAYVQELGDELAAQTELSHREWTFTVVDEPTVNAFNIPGGRVYVNRGLLEAVDTEEQLLGVLAHEVSHGEARHATEQLTRTYGIVLAASLLLGENPGLVEEIAAEVAAAGTVAKFSRDAEREADRLALASLAAAGHEPSALAEFFAVLRAEQTRRPTAVEQIFSTHPLTEERIEDVGRNSRDLVVASGRKVDPERLEAIQARLAAS